MRGPATTSPAPGAESAGFTLLEVLVALTVTGLLLAGVYLALDVALGAADRSRTLQEEARRSRNARLVLSSLLRSARVGVERDTAFFLGLDASVAPSGGDELRFVGSLGFRLLRYEAGEDLRVRIRAADGSGEGPSGLYLELSPGRTGEARTDTLLLLPDVVGVQIDYRDSRGEWRASWSERSTLPEAVRIEFAPSEFPPMPPIFIALRMGRSV